MKIIVNGEDIQTERTTISGLLEELDIVAGRVAVEVNLKVIKKAEYEAHELHDGDAVEIVYFVGGG